MRMRPFLALLWVGCGSGTISPPKSGNDSGADPWECVLDVQAPPDGSPTIGCWDDFALLASDPLDASIPGAESTKTIVDRIDGNRLTFVNSERYPIHYDYASQFLSGNGLPVVADMGSFNATEYFSPDRRFVLGAVTFYAEPNVFVYEIAPYDTADADMVADAFRRIRDASYFGADLRFHPSSSAVEEMAKLLPDDIPIITTDELFAGITYQPLNLGTSMGLLRFYHAADVEEYVNYREIVVLDEIPNDISVVAGTITDEFQTPLAHINVLAQNRGTPNMALRGAFEDPRLRAFEGQWVELTVNALDWSVRAVSEAEAEAWWEAHRPAPVDVRPMDTSVDGVWACPDIIDGSVSLSDAIAERIPAFGGKLTHMAVMSQIGPSVPVPDCFGIPLYWYDQHMQSNGLWDEYARLQTLPEWATPAERAALLKDLQAAIEAAPLDATLLSLVRARIDGDFGRAKMRFRSSTNAEDLGGFSGAGLYTSKSGEWDADGTDISNAIREVWASVWNPRAWEEREYWGIPHTSVGMALLVNPTFDGELANGVAITANIFDAAGLEPAFYINAAAGETSVVLPEDGVTTEQILYYYYSPGQPIVYIRRSNQVPEGQTVLSNVDLYALGSALDAIHQTFLPVYGRDGGFYAMDTEFKVTAAGDVMIKQARPYPGWASSEGAR